MKLILRWILILPLFLVVAGVLLFIAWLCDNDCQGYRQVINEVFAEKFLPTKKD
jgi:hypothetical protein